MIDIEKLKALVANQDHIEFIENRPNPLCMKCALPDLLALLEEARTTMARIESAPNYITLGEVQDWVRAFLSKFDTEREG